MNTRPARVERGFSLIELLVVVAIMLILASIAVPNLMRYIRLFRLRGASQQLQAEITRARQMAIMRNVNAGVLLLVEDNRHYRIVIEDSQADATRGQPINVATAIAANDRAQVQARRELPLEVLFSNTANCVAPATTTHPAVRFGRLGAAQSVNTGAGFPDVNTGELWIRNDGAGVLALCLEDQRNGLTKQLSITNGGRVRIDNNY